MEHLSKEKILGNNDIGRGSLYFNRAMDSMDEYSRQMAIGFANWIEKENTIWCNEKEEPLTDDELYELYISQSFKK